MSQAEKQKNLGNEEFKNGNFPKAIEHYTYATELDPKNPVYFTNRSMCYFKMQEWAKSLRDAEKSIALNSSWVKGYYRAGMAHIELAQLTEALKNLEKAAELEPGTPAYKQAADDCKAKLFASMTKAETVKYEGNQFFRAGEIDKAIEKYTEAIKLSTNKDGNPKDAEEKTIQVLADSYSNRAMSYQQRWDYSAVVDDCTKCLELINDHVKALVRRAQAYEALEKYKLSLADFERATLLSPSLDVAIKGSIRVRNILKNQGGL